VQKRIKDYRLEVVISDSHSSDTTATLVKKLSWKNKNVHYLDVQRRGLGWALVRGLDYAGDRLSADVLITMEADLSNNPDQVPQFLAALDRADLVIGSRYIKGGKVMNWSWWRKALSLTANLLLRILVWAPDVHEFTNLYRGFKRDVWVKIRPEVRGHRDWIFVPAFIFAALGRALRIREVPIIYYDRFGGRSKMNTLSYSKNLLRYALRYRLRKFV